jgi:TRAP-type uncharacterized transport system substrate-binding protein
MLWIKRCFMILLIAALIAAGGCAPAKESAEVADSEPVEKTAGEQGSGNLSFDQPYELLWGTMTAGSPWQVLGTAFLEDIKKNLPNVTGSILPTNATANLLGVHKGEFNIAFSLSDRTAEAWDGKAFLKKRGNSRI